MMGLPLAIWLFGAVTLLLTVAALGFVLWPLFSRNAGGVAKLSRKQTNITLYRERVAELQNAVASGEMTAEDARLQEEEAGRHLLEDARAEPSVNPAPKSGGQWLFVVAALFVPALALLVYLQGDGWRLLEADEQSPPWDFIIQRAQARLENNPQDVETWAFLARSYRALERYADSAGAYASLNAINQPPNPELLVEEGEMLALAGEGNMRGRPTELFSQALQIDPDHGRALWYAGLAALQREDHASAVTYWQRLAQQELPDNFRQVLNRQLQKLGAEVPEGPAPVQPALPPVIKLRVTADAALTAGLPPDTPVFVYARAEEGPAQPLAALRLTLASLPAEVTLTDAMQMAGGPALSSFERWTVFARISLGGAAQASKGDPFGSLELNESAALEGKELKIDARWPQ